MYLCSRAVENPLVDDIKSPPPPHTHTPCILTICYDLPFCTSDSPLRFHTTNLGRSIVYTEEEFKVIFKQCTFVFLSLNVIFVLEICDDSAEIPHFAKV